MNSTRVGGNRKRKCCGKKNIRGGMATVRWDQIPMNQPSNEVMEKATTAPRSLLGGRRRTHRGHKKSHKAKRHHHRRSKRHHRK
jgi:hypothetical protein